MEGGEQWRVEMVGKCYKELNYQVTRGERWNLGKVKCLGNGMQFGSDERTLGNPTMSEPTAETSSKLQRAVVKVRTQPVKHGDVSRLRYANTAETKAIRQLHNS